MRRHSNGVPRWAGPLFLVLLALTLMLPLARACDITHDPWNHEPAFSPPDYSCQPHNVPEPSTLLLLAAALVGYIGAAVVTDRYLKGR
jgi:hypothetical protein